MTAQIPEMLRYQGQDLDMCTTPLCDYFDASRIDSPFVSYNTALRRGYVGRWEIADDRLYLVQLEGDLEDGSSGSLESVFPGSGGRVFARWFSGTIRIPEGGLLAYVHMGYGSTYERDVFLKIRQGCVVSRRIRVNGEADEASAPEGYVVGAMTLFPRPEAG